MYKHGEIVLIPVPFSDLSSVKKRPVLIISNTSHNKTRNDIIVVAITSNLKQNGIVI
jgi:mRNA interferase MazF